MVLILRDFPLYQIVLSLICFLNSYMKVMPAFLKSFTFFFLSLAFVPQTSIAQKKLEKEKKEILGEGLALYTLVLANWTSNDLYYENEFNTGIVKGYLSYRDKDTIKTIFWKEVDTTSAEYKAKIFKQVGDTVADLNQEKKKLQDTRFIIKTIRYAKMNVSKDNSEIRDEEERNPNEKEKILMDYRKEVYDMISKDTSFFKQYEGTVFKAVPFDAGKQVKVYIYSSVKKEGIVPFGGDYLLLFDKKTNELVEKKDLHRECIFISGQYKGKSYDASKATIHSHKPGAAELITPTDIATLLLYKSQIEWDEHHVIAGKYTCVFTLVDRKLDIIPTSEFQSLKKMKTAKDNEEKQEKIH